MKQYLSILLRNKFNLFYRFGYTYIPNSELVEFEGTLSEEIKVKLVNNFATTTPFEYDEEYLILHLDKQHQNDNPFTQFEIQDIISIYPLSKQAKISIESKIDQRIKLETPIFETLLPAIETEIENKEVEKAISAIWKICKIDSPLEKYLSDLGIENIFNGIKHRKKGAKANKIQNGNYWEYLIAYDYFQYFPEGIIRHFYQLGEVFSYYKGKSDGIEGTKIENILKQIGSGNFEQVLQKFNKKTLPTSFIETMNEIGKSEFNPIIVSVLFLKWKSDLSNQDISILKSTVFHNGKIAFIDKFPTEVKLALILLGAFYGFRKFYDNYYEVLNLRFYKDFQSPQKEFTIDLRNNVTENLVTDENNEEENLSNKPVEENKTEERTIETDIKELEQTQETSNVQTVLKDKKENKSDISSQYQKIIQDALSKQSEIKMADISAMIKEKTGQSTQVGIVANVAKQMNEIEIIKIGRAKGIRKKGTLGTLFNQ